MADPRDDYVPSWSDLDRSDWPEIQSPDFGGLWPDGTPIMQVVCPGCGLYREHDEAPDDHFDDMGPCPWAASHSGREADRHAESDARFDSIEQDRRDFEGRMP